MEEVLLLNEFVQDWQFFLNGEKTPDIKAVVWFDQKQQKYLIQVLPEKYGSFGLHGKRLNQKDDINMEFIHVGGFFAVAYGNLDTTVEFLQANGYK